MDNILLNPIGKIITPFQRIADCPKNSRFAQDAESTILVDEQYQEALLDIESASHLIILYWLDKAQRDRLFVKTHLDGEIRGAFATRAPHRPNPIGVSVVKLLERASNNLRVVGLDCLDGTLLVDIKPYIAHNDAFSEASIAWQ